MTTTIGDFTITGLADGAAVRFSIADPTMLPRFKQAFPRARFAVATRSWHVPGRLAVDRVAGFAEAVAQERRVEQARIEQILRDAEFDGQPVALDTPGLEGHQYLAALALNGQRLSSPHVLVSVWGESVRVRFPYDETAVALIRAIPGAHFHRDTKDWSISVAKVRLLHGMIDRMEASLARASATEEEARGQGDQEPDWLTGLRAHEATSQRRLANRILMLVALRPAVGAIVRLNAKARVIEGYGCSFVVDANTASVWGPHFRGQEGQPCCYAYTRAATSRETVALEAQEAACEAERVRLLRMGRARWVGRGYAVAHPHPSAHRHQS